MNVKFLQLIMSTGTSEESLNVAVIPASKLKTSEYEVIDFESHQSGIG